MVRLFLVRHGETMENVAQTLQGHLPGTLSPEGWRQAEALRRKLAGQGARFDAFLCSDLRRAVQTAETVNRSLEMPIELCPLLRERDWGAATGQRIGTVRLDPLPVGAESEEAMFARARRLLLYIRSKYDGGRVLAVGHGLFNRVLLATLSGSTIREVPRMGNAEVREVSYDRLPCVRRLGADEVAAD